MIVIGIATGLAATDKLQDRASWILAGVVLILAMYFWWFPGAAGLRCPARDYVWGDAGGDFYQQR